MILPHADYDYGALADADEIFTVHYIHLSPGEKPNHWTLFTNQVHADFPSEEAALAFKETVTHFTSDIRITRRTNYKSLSMAEYKKLLKSQRAFYQHLKRLALMQEPQVMKTEFWVEVSHDLAECEASCA